MDRKDAHMLLSVQEVVTHLFSNLLYEMGHSFLDTQYMCNYSKKPFYGETTGFIFTHFYFFH